MKATYTWCPICSRKLIWGCMNIEVDDKCRYYCPDCHWVHYDNPLPVAVAAVTRSDRIFIIQRKNEPGAGAWALPGGFMESGESPEQACLRELEEETGFQGEVRQLVGVYYRESEMYGSIIIIGYHVAYTGGELRMNHEVQNADFFDSAVVPFIPFPSHKDIIENIFRKNEQEYE
mgnify:CR=1 FL=1